MRVRQAYDDGVVKQPQAPPPPWHPLAWADALTQFGRTEIAGGLVLTVALAAALVWANVDTHSYAAVWSHLVTADSNRYRHPPHGGRRTSTTVS